MPAEKGELVARWILDKAGNQKPLKRLWISSVTDKAIREGFQNLRPGKSYEHCTALLLPVHSPTGWSGSMPPER